MYKGRPEVGDIGRTKIGGVDNNPSASGPEGESRSAVRPPIYAKSEPLPTA
jgi:hypothetical protein